MIASVRGPVLEVRLEHAVIEVGGVGLAVQVTPSTAGQLRVGEEARLATTLVVREESMTLYGFLDTVERGVFETIPPSHHQRPSRPDSPGATARVHGAQPIDVYPRS